MPEFIVHKGGEKWKITAPDEATAFDAWNKSMGAEPQIEQAPKFTGGLAAGIRGWADTATLGTSDEMVAGLNTLWNKATGKGPQTYEENLASPRAAQAYDEQNYPKSRIAGQVAGGIGSGVGMARAGLLATPRMVGAALPARAAVAAGEGATLGTAYGLGSGTDSADRLNKAAEGAAIGAALGPVAEAAAPVIGRAAQGAANMVRGAFGGAPDPIEVITRARAQLSLSLGIPANEIPDSLAQQFAQQAERAVDPQATARAVAAQEFGIHLPRGQATNDIGEQAFEEAARHNARGAAAGNTMRTLDDANWEAMQRSAGQIAEDVAGGRPVAARPQELMEDVLGGVRQAEEASLANIDAAYDAARAGRAEVDINAVERAGERVRARLAEDEFIINPGSYGARALQVVDNMTQLRGSLDNLADPGPGLQQGDRVVGVNLAGIERTRSTLLKLAQRATDPGDRAAVIATRRAFDDWLDDAADNGMMRGDEGALDMFRAARAARREHGRRFEANKGQGDDDAGRIIEKFINKDVTTTEVANYLIGSAKAGERGLSVRLATRLRDILEPDSPEFQSLRQAVWLNLTQGSQGGVAGRPGAQAMATRINQFLGGGADPYARVLYNEAERATMRRFANAVASTVPNPRATNPSKSGYEGARAVQALANSLMGMFGTAATGNPAIGLALRTASSLGTNARGSMQARRAARGAPRARWGDVPVAPVVRGGLAGGVQGYNASGAEVPSLPVRMPY
jgi:hypothetical protein